MKSISSLLILFILSACGSNKADQPVIIEDTVTTMADNYIWQSTLDDSTGKLQLVAVQPVPTDSTQPANVVRLINKSSIETGFAAKVRLDFIKTSGDTIYLKIDDATYLTQQMGSTGPRLFLSGVVYTLTGLTGINYVNIDFEEGDHAGPGTYSRESFKDE
ncbi:MAG: GerMN domain-containing protein [Chitinophagaceae bacterium]